MSKALFRLKKQMEIDFLKTKTYEEINDMFNQLSDKLRIAENKVKENELLHSVIKCDSCLKDDMELICYKCNKIHIKAKNKS